MKREIKNEIITFLFLMLDSLISRFSQIMFVGSGAGLIWGSSPSSFQEILSGFIMSLIASL